MESVISAVMVPPLLGLKKKRKLGSSLIEMMIERTLGGKVARSYAPDGLIATFRLKPEGPLG